MDAKANGKQQLQQALTTARYELNYEKSSRIVQGVAKDEEIRKLKFSMAVKEDEIEDLSSVSMPVSLARPRSRDAPML